ncbi:hypothetical protein BDN72DRAFT_961243 [Pluteus cervinus]|uniref:Uncharacterized protein n=1 Tax=Pluteus cervinus TaxID=181527 RepID=A0ACD3ANK7_9AGAR|nr:hypothetical protein BDN72DRAFT_961243 [Pluteus cervinus]
MQSTAPESQGNSMDMKRIEIDAKIHDFEEAILALKRERNTLSPICRLPYDILASIFQRVAEDGVLDLPWIKALTHVCSHWRTVALNFPMLWTEINFKCSDLVLAKLDRSQSALLSVQYRVERRKPENKLDSLISALRHLHRIQDLGLAMPASWFESGVLDTLSFPAPALEKCFIHVSQPKSPQQPHWIDLPDDMFPSFSHLTSLQLRHCIFDWTDLINLPRLTTLDVADPGDVQVTSDSLLHILKQLPLLQSLRLVKCLPPPASTTIPNPTLTLDHLTTVDITDETSRCTHFLHQLIIAPDLVIQINCQDVSSHVDWLTAFISHFWKTKSSSGRPVKSLNFCRPFSYENFNLKLEVGSETTPELEPDMTITFSEVNTEITSESDYFHMLLTPIDLQPALFIRLNIELHEPLWEFLAEYAPNVQEIGFMLREVDSFFPVLDHDRGSYAFLHLDAMIFNQPCTVSFSSRRRLLTYLRAKHRMGRPCRVLELITRDGFPKRYVAELKKYVRGVFCEDDGTSLAHLSDDMYDGSEEEGSDSD